MAAHRSRLATLAGAPRADCIVPKTSAGQGLRAVLNTYDRAPRVVATRGEFDSLDLILREYARRGRVTLDVRRAGRRRAVCGGRRAGRARARRGSRRGVAGDVPDGPGDAGAAANRRRGACGRRARAARCLPFARGASRSTSRRSTSTSRSAGATSTCGAVRARASSIVAPRHLDARVGDARRRLVRQGSAVRLRAPGSAALCRRRRRVARVHAGGAAALSGARRTAVHAGGRRRAAARLLARNAAAARGASRRARNRGERRNGGPRRVRHGPRSRGAGARGRARGARHRHRRARRMAAPVPGRADDRRRADAGRRRACRHRVP